jgi:hypothetical protein
MKKQPKVRKLAKDLTPDERRKESEKRAGRRVAVRNRQNTARLEEEHRQESGSLPLKPCPTARSWQARRPCTPS